jgi:class 3 adenylate cyclase/SAM-dependent methyltransferase
MGAMSPTRTATIMFTDLVASTARAARVGTTRGAELRREHFRLVRRVLVEHRGTEVKTLGDGVMGVFDSVADAVNASVALQQSLATANRTKPDPLEVRVGLSVGEITDEAGDVFGPAVIEGARLCREPAPGQVLCASVVRILAEGHCPHVFRGAGTRTLKGLPGPVNVDEVTWEPLVEPGVFSDFAHVDARSPSSALHLLDQQHCPDFQSHLPYAELRRRITELLAPRRGQVLLDVGCGAGDDAIELAELVGPDGSVIGVDKSEGMIAEALGRAAQLGVGNVEFRVGDAENLPVDDNRVDGGRSDRVFQYLTDPARALAELRRVTHPGGVVVVADTDWGASVFDCEDLDLSVRIDNAWTVTRPSGRVGRQLFGLFVRAGFDDVRVFPHSSANVVRPDGGPDLASFGEAVLQAFASQAAEVGAVTAEEASRWLALQRAAASEGRFLRFLAMFVVAGRVPTN